VETTGSRRVYENRWMSIREDTVRRADGSTGIYAVVETPDVAVVIPVDGDRFHLVEQYRYPVAGRRWEFPSGSAEEGDDSDAAALARRELREETGLLAADLRVLGTLEVTPSMIAHQCTVFLATELSEGQPCRDLAEQDMRSAWFSRTQVERMIRTGQIVDAKSIAALMLLVLTERT
jgi:8-oxo-dGTP pyrophosphatase MutT (NUDIX family)